MMSWSNAVFVPCYGCCFRLSEGSNRMVFSPSSASLTLFISSAVEEIVSPAHPWYLYLAPRHHFVLAKLYLGGETSLLRTRFQGVPFKTIRRRVR
ncbi:hypothetical protein JTE90_005202 [Oedothorax gibbosus]|uniref:Secreted protein n=1 Tax=Oedothorax gibbosus TaxID=931172 RepID=A0AAV6ULM2_9ARAC|nr:hypothetical protein JTE90_005202 [Oedothorax gibbosus]